MVEHRPSLEQAQETLARLSARRFSPSVVMEAVRINRATLGNYLTKTNLTLCSNSGGQGRARQFCLIDIYQLYFLARWIGIAGTAGWSAEALNGLLFDRHYTPTVDASTGRETRVDLDLLRRNFCESAGRWPAAYNWRDVDRPYMACAQLAHIAVGHPHINCVQISPNEPMQPRSDSPSDTSWGNGRFLNLTRAGASTFDMTASLVELDGRIERALGRLGQ